MNQKVKQLVFVTHSGDFHPDDVWAAATLFLAFEKGLIEGSTGNGVTPKIIRTRDEKLIETGDIVFDVGGKYDPAKKRFDHHQKGGAGKRENGIPYASFGLVWKEYGKALGGSDYVFADIDKRIASPVDSVDNGVAISKPVFAGITSYAFDNVIFTFRPTWKEDEKKIDEFFLNAVDMAKALLEREIVCSRDMEEAHEIVKNVYESSSDKQIIVFDKKYQYPVQATLLEYSEPLYAVYPNESDNTWHVKAVWTGMQFVNRKDFPTSWRGKKDSELVAATGVSDALFCHNAGFLAVTRTKEGALKLAKLAVESQ